MDDSKFDTYEKVIRSFLLMVKKTVKFEKFHLMKKNKQAYLMFPLFDIAKRSLYTFYKKWLETRMFLSEDGYLEDLINSMEN